MRVAVVGSGPAGIYAADELVRRTDAEICVDLIDRLPVPYGLVRYGVAPDHPRIKNIVVSLRRVLENPRVRFLGDVQVGSDVTPRELASTYDAVVFATGAPAEARLSIPGDDLPGSMAAAELVSWYSGHPDADPLQELSVNTVGVVGAGNVALDLVRILAKHPDDLESTDMPNAVLAGLHRSRVREIHLLCRRGPQHAKFTTKELRELTELEDVRFVANPAVFEVDDASVSGAAASNLAVFRELTSRPVADPRRVVHLHFWARPHRVLGSENVQGIEVEAMEPGEDGAPRGTGRHSEIALQLLVSAIGYRGVPLPELPFDERSGTVPNVGGRVVAEPASAMGRVYVAGWAKRGPNGVVGTNRADAAETIRTLMADLEGRARPMAPEDPPFVIKASNYEGWLRIDAEEVLRGHAAGRARTKVSDWATLRRLSRVEGR